MSAIFVYCLLPGDRISAARDTFSGRALPNGVFDWEDAKPTPYSESRVGGKSEGMFPSAWRWKFECSSPSSGLQATESTSGPSNKALRLRLLTDSSRNSCHLVLS
jgi:hypothetical protein